MELIYTECGRVAPGHHVEKDACQDLGPGKKPTVRGLKFLILGGLGGCVLASGRGIIAM